MEERRLGPVVGLGTFGGDAELARDIVSTAAFAEAAGSHARRLVR
jgi:hypothetical protein